MALTARLRVSRGTDEVAAVRDDLLAPALDYDVSPSPLVVHVFTAEPTVADEALGWRSVVPADRLRVVAVNPTGEGGVEGRRALLLAALGRALTQASGGPRVPFQRGRDRARISIRRGSRVAPAVLCVPGAGANATDFVALAGALAERHRVESFQARGMDVTMVPHSTVQAAARVYCACLNEGDFAGEVHLVGHSFGGWVAFEMAVRLQAAGRRVASLTILDSECPRGADREYTRGEALMKLGGLYERAANRPLDIKLPDLEEREPDAQLAYLHGRLVRAGLIHARSEPSVLRGPVRSFEAAVRTHYLTDQVFEGAARLVLVPDVDEPEEEATRRFEREVSQWRRLLPRLQFRRGAGNHVTMLKDPHIQGVASWIQEHLGRPESAGEIALARGGQSVAGAVAP